MNITSHDKSYYSMPLRIKIPAAVSHNSKLLGSSVELARIVRSTFPSICILLGAFASISISIAVVTIIFAIPLSCSLYPSGLRCLSCVRALVLKDYGCESTYIVAPRIGNPSCSLVVHTFVVSWHVRGVRERLRLLDDGIKVEATNGSSQKSGRYTFSQRAIDYKMLGLLTQYLFLERVLQGLIYSYLYLKWRYLFCFCTQDLAPISEDPAGLPSVLS